MNRTIDSKATEHPINSQSVADDLNTDQIGIASVAQNNSSVLRAQMQQMEKTIAHLKIAQTKLKHKSDD